MKETKINDLIPDDKNFNEGTQYGQHLIEESLRKFGAGRSVLIDKNNRIIAGNKTIENAAAIGLEDVIVAETTGDKIVAVKRTDVDLDSKEGREMALADNATGMVNLRWDEAALAEAEAEFGIAPSEWGIAKVDPVPTIDDFFEAYHANDQQPKGVVIEIKIPEEEKDLEGEVRDKVKEALIGYPNITLK